MQFEYIAVPAPTRGEKAKDAKTPGERYALALSEELNRMAADGWEYIRADVLPSEERTGLTGRSTVYHNLLIFRRAAPRATENATTSVTVPVTSPDPVKKPHERKLPAVDPKPVTTDPDTKDALTGTGSGTSSPIRND